MANVESARDRSVSEAYDEASRDALGGVRTDVFGAVSVGPYEVSDELRPRIDELGLWKSIDQIREHGYAVIRGAAPAELLDELREATHSLAELTETRPQDHAPLLLGRHPAVDLVATLPEILAFAEFSCGKGVRAGKFVGSIKREGDDGLPLHADLNWVPAPFPEQHLMATFCIACEGMTEAGGSTLVVPDSHLLRRHPTQEEVKSAKSVPIEAEKGDVVVWLGSTWHGSGTRTIPGTRTMLHSTYQRLYTQPIEDFSHLRDDPEYLASAPEGMRDLLGVDLFFGTATQTVDNDMVKFERTSAASRL